MSQLIKKTAILAMATTSGLALLFSVLPGKASTETGSAKFLRDHDAALAQAKKTKKPVFAFFQEVPG